MKHRTNNRCNPRMPMMLALVVTICLMLAGCTSSETEAMLPENYDLSYSDRDLDASYDAENAATILLSGNGISIDGSGASSEGSTLTITGEGTYILSGELEDGQIIIDTPEDEKVQLILDHVSIASSGSAPILIRSCDKVFLTLAEGSDNTLTGPDSFDNNSTEDNIDGVIFSKGDLCINGSGSLRVTAAAGNGIVSKDDLIITGGTLSITAAGDGIQGKDCVKIREGTITIAAEEDGIKSTNQQDAERGFVSIDGGTFTITAGCDGIQAETLLRIAGGSLAITTGGGSQYTSLQSDWRENWGSLQEMPAMEDRATDAQLPQEPAPPEDSQPAKEDGHQTTGGQNDQTSGAESDLSSAGAEEDQAAGAEGAQTAEGTAGASDSGDAADTTSAKGLKGSLGVLITGSSLSIDSSDDSVHSNGDLEIRDGSLELTSGDDGIHADSDLTVSGGSIKIARSYEGIEGNTITIEDGTLDITASDDGLNAAGGNDASSTDGRAGQNSFAVDETAFLTISGGSLKIDASGDGIDSNGHLTISGGSVELSGPVDDGNGALDYNGNGTVEGGTLMLAASAGMAMNFDEDSSQCALLYGFSSSQSAGSQVSLTDPSGDTLLSFSPDKGYRSVLFSCEAMKTGETYSVCVDGQQVDSVTLSSVITNAGSISSGGMPEGQQPAEGGLPQQ